MKYTDQFVNAGKFLPEEVFIKDNIVLETLMGSHAYGCNNPDSDFDVVAIYMDRHQDLYPQAYGKILGFDQLTPVYHKECKGEQERIVLSSDPNGRTCEAEWRALSKFILLAGVDASPPKVVS
jgi:hypothetical protein